MGLIQAMVKKLVLILALAALGASAALAGPPYLTDDPEPVPEHHWELYTFATRDQARGANTVAAPAIEVNNGVAPNTQAHLIIPEAYLSQDGVVTRGLGDLEVGVKYRFLTEANSRPEIGIFPLIEIPTGDQAKGLGNGRAYFKAPIWLQKTYGAWTAYGGGGRAFNSAPGQRDYWYGGLLIQRTLSPHLTLGAELFAQGAQVEFTSPAATATSGERPSTLWNFGGSYNFTPDFSLLFSEGHSLRGEGHSMLYISLYRTWGPGAP